MIKIEEMTTESLREELDKAVEREKTSRENFKKYEKIFLDTLNKKNRIVEELDARKIEEGVDIPWLLEGNTSTARYETAVKRWPPNGPVFVCGTYQTTNQRCFTVVLPKNSKKDVDKAEKILLEVLPHIKPVFEDFKEFKITEKGLSEFYIFYLRVKFEDGQWNAMIVETRFGDSVLFHGSLRACLEEISDKYWYE